jgi:hypothetical protein
LAAAGATRAAARAHVVDARRLVLVEQGVAAGLGVAPVLVEHGQHQPLAVAEVVLHRAGVVLPGQPVDLAQRHAVDAPDGEELLGGADDQVAGVTLGARGRAHRPLAASFPL